MPSKFGPFRFSQILSTSSSEAFDFHVTFYNKEYIWLREQAQMEHYASDGELFGVRNSASGELAGICYVTFDEKENRWELGGLSTSRAFQELGLATVLGRFALARTIAEKTPWVSNQEIIAHVHEENQSPRNLLKRIGFQQGGQEKIPPGIAPPSMKRNAAGDVVGDVFVFPKAAVGQLSSAVEKDCEKPLRDGSTLAQFDLGIWSLANLIEALREAAK